MRENDAVVSACELTRNDRLKCLRAQKRHLDNWTQWLQRRRDFQARLARVLRRRPSELLFNSGGDSYRRRVEERLAFEYATVPRRDPIRPLDFWAMPYRIERPPGDPICAALTRHQKCQTPVVEYCAIPDIILEEMARAPQDDVRGANRSSVRATGSDYRKKREAELGDNMKRVRPHMPDLKRVVVVGQSPERLNAIAKNRDVPSVTISPPSDDDDDDDDDDDHNDNDEAYVKIASMTIDRYAFASTDDAQNVVTQHVPMEYGVDDDVIDVEKTIVVRNTGTLTLRYYWSKVPRPAVLADVVPIPVPKTSFLFKKTETVLPPGQSREIRIYLGSDSLGIHEETYGLVTVPTVFRPGGGYFLHLWAHVREARLRIACGMLKRRLETGAVYRMVRQTLDELLRRVRVRHVCGRIDANCWDWDAVIEESDVFEAVNAVGPVDRFGPPTTYRYDKYVVDELKRFYESICSGDDRRKRWNYSLTEVERLVDECGNDDRERKRRLTAEFAGIVGKLRATREFLNVDRTIYSRVYDFLCVVVDRIAIEVRALRAEHGICSSDVYPSLDAEERPQIARKTDVFYLRSSETAFLEADCRPATTDTDARSRLKGLADVPKGDVSGLHREYFLHKYGVTPREYYEERAKIDEEKEREAKQQQQLLQQQLQQQPIIRESASSVMRLRKNRMTQAQQQFEKSISVRGTSAAECSKQLKKKIKRERQAKERAKEKVLSVAELMPSVEDSDINVELADEESDARVYQDAVHSYVYETLGDAVEILCDIVDELRKRDACPDRLLRQLVRLSAFDGSDHPRPELQSVSKALVDAVHDNDDGDDGNDGNDVESKSLRLLYKNRRTLDEWDAAYTTLSSSSDHDTSDDLRPERPSSSSGEFLFSFPVMDKRRAGNETNDRPQKKIVDEEAEEELISVLNYDMTRKISRRNVNTSTTGGQVYPARSPKIREISIQTDPIPEEELVDLIALIEREIGRTSVHGLNSNDSRGRSTADDSSGSVCVCWDNSLLDCGFKETDEEIVSVTTGRKSVDSFEILEMIRSRRWSELRKKNVNTDYY